MKITKVNAKKAVKDRVVTESILEEKLDEKLKKFVTKDFLEEKLDERLEEYSQQVIKDISDLQDTKWAENDKKLDRIMITQDKILKKFENWEIEDAVGAEQLSRLRADVDDHTKRIKLLEARKN